jgi:hypothetical protein
MGALVGFLHRLLNEGKVRLKERPVRSTGKSATEAADLLKSAFEDYRLNVAGPVIPFDPEAALGAAEVVRQACWYLLNHAEQESELRQQLALPGPPTTPAQHLSADLVLRYLPQIHRRARALAPADVLPGLLADVLRRWPFTGVLADIEDEPLTPLDLGGHPGLMLLYAERLAEHEKAAWFPHGRPLEYVDWVYQGLGKEKSVGLHQERGVHERK